MRGALRPSSGRLFLSWEQALTRTHGAHFRLPHAAPDGTSRSQRSPRRPHAGLDFPWLSHNMRGRSTETNEQKHKGKRQINAFCGFRFSIYETHGECFNFHNG